MENLIDWVASELSSILQFPVTNDMAKCIASIESNRDLEEYLKTLLDLSNPTHYKFLKDLVQKKQSALVSNSHGYKKAELDNYITSKTQEKKKKGNKSKQEVKKNESVPEQEDQAQSTKKKNKFINIFNHDDTVLLKGRHRCDCQASKHGLINNCLKCGRIVCEQEGSGPCFFCKSPVYSREEERVMRSNPGHTQKFSGFRPPDGNTSLESALELRDRLLEYDRSSERRTHVIDDENDYFSSNSVWLSKEKRDEFKKKIEDLQAIKNSRGTQKLNLDFTGRYTLTDDAAVESLNQENRLLQEIADIFGESTNYSENFNIDPKSTIDLHPVYESSQTETEKFGSRWHNVIGRVQDRQVMEMTDSGMCLSMHQPWASLLISGIKIHEGRSWYTSHRGRLWIAAAAKVPTKEEIKEIENDYKYLKGDSIKFPSHYPAGCLLGCVNLVDCLAQEEYREIYPDGESDSPFVFICENPVKCPVMFPLQGKHKIYKLEPKIHQAAAKCIQRLATVKNSS